MKLCEVSTAAPAAPDRVLLLEKGTNFNYTTARCAGRPIWLVKAALFSVALFHFRIVKAINSKSWESWQLFETDLLVNVGVI